MASAVIACSPIGTYQIWRDDEHRAIIVDGRLIRFSPLQYRLVQSLLDGLLKTDAELVKKVCSCEVDVYGRENLVKHIKMIRSKLRPFGLYVSRTINRGYMLIDESD